MTWVCRLDHRPDHGSDHGLDHGSDHRSLEILCDKPK